MTRNGRDINSSEVTPRMAWLTCAAAVLATPDARLRQALAASLPHGQDASNLRFRGCLAPGQGIQNGGAVLHWRLEDSAGHVRAAAYEKLLLRPTRAIGHRMPQDWQAEARVLAGLHPRVVNPGCTLPRLIMLRRHGQALGVVTDDLTLSGWRLLDVAQAAAEAPQIAARLAALATDYRVEPPLAARHMTMPVAQAFFIARVPGRLERMRRMLARSGIRRDRRNRCLTGLRRIHMNWDRLIAASGLP